MNRLTSKFLPLLLILSAVTSGCGDAANVATAGDVQVVVEAENTIAEGFTAGDTSAPALGMWNVKFTRFLVTIGNLRAGKKDNAEPFSAASVYVLDLMNVPEDGYLLQTWFGVEATTWPNFGFDIPIATDDAIPIAPATDEDRTLLVGKQAAIYIEGTVGDGMTSKAFKWFMPKGVAYDGCADDKKIAGFTVTANETNKLRIVIHGDHWFANKYPPDPMSTKRYAHYVIAGDLDMDGETTFAELEGIKDADVANLFPSDSYELGGTKFSTALEWVLGQAETVGNFQGVGECPMRAVLPMVMP